MITVIICGVLIILAFWAGWESALWVQKTMVNKGECVFWAQGKWRGLPKALVSIARQVDKPDEPDATQCLEYDEAETVSR